MKVLVGGEWVPLSDVADTMVCGENPLVEAIKAFFCG